MSKLTAVARLAHVRIALHVSEEALAGLTATLARSASAAGKAMRTVGWATAEFGTAVSDVHAATSVLAGARTVVLAGHVACLVHVLPAVAQPLRCTETLYGRTLIPGKLNYKQDAMTTHFVLFLVG